MKTEEAIKILSRYDNEYYTPATRKAHRIGIEALKKCSWVSVKDRLPEESGWYLVHTERGSRMVMDYSAKYKQFNVFDNGIGKPIKCTYWMPMPEILE